MTRDQSTVPDLTLERYHLRELPADEAAYVSLRAATDPDVRARLAAIARSDAEINEQHPAHGLARSIAERIAREQSSRSGTWGTAAWVGVASAAAVFIAFAIWAPSTPATPAGAPPAADRIKGEAAQLLLHRKVGASSELMTDGDAARRGDLVRLAYRASGPCFGVILSIDGRGVVTRHLPVTGAAPADLQPGATTLLDEAYELDDAPRWERFFLITSDATFDVQMVIDTARVVAAKVGTDAPATLPLPAFLDQSSFLLRKTSKEASAR